MTEKIKLQKFVDELPIPNTLSPKMQSNNSSYYEETMKEFSQKLHRDLGPARLWGYEGTFPGPTFDVMKNETVFVKWINDLPNKHFLPVDTTIHGSEITLPEGRTVVHLHGGRTPAHSDGYPETWFTRNFKQTGTLFEREVYTYPNIEPATMSLYYPSKPNQNDVGLPYPSLVSPFDADTILVNGRVYPFLEVEPRKYRFRILNASNSRILTLKMDSNQPFYQIGTDRWIS